jgi:predicted heme/steroid binding protein
MQTFTPHELAQHNGRDGARVCITYAGKVYDAFGSWHWRGGRHQAAHDAGEDYTDPARGLGQAPHDPDLLARLPVLGVLVDDQPGENSASSS